MGRGNKGRSIQPPGNHRRTTTVRSSGTDKQVKVLQKSTDKEKLIWRFGRRDRSGEKFCFDHRRPEVQDKYELLFETIIEYSDRTWEDIKKESHDSKGKTKHHHISIEAVSKDGVGRIKALHVSESEYDCLFSFRLNNLMRFIGLRKGAEFHVIWFDPLHEFCPSKR